MRRFQSGITRCADPSWRRVPAYVYWAYRLVALDSPRAARAPHQLPPGRHGLARSFVARNQRERILAAVATVASKRGYGGMSVQDIVREAGVSRRTFYEQFKNNIALGPIPSGTGVSPDHKVVDDSATLSALVLQDQ